MQVTVYFTPERFEQLNNQAKQAGLSRSALLQKYVQENAEPKVVLTSKQELQAALREELAKLPKNLRLLGK